MNAIRFPLTVITLFFAGGILAASLYLPPFSVLLPAYCCAIAVLSAMSFLIRTKPRLMFLAPVCSAFTALFAGALVFMANHSSSDPNHYLNFIGNPELTHAISAEVTEKLKSTPTFDRYICKIDRLNEHQVSGMALLSIRKDSSSIVILPGQRVILQSFIHKHSRPLNPYQFDYGKYLDNKSVHAQIRTDPDDVILLQRPNKGMLYYAASIRQRIIAQLETSDFRKEELNIVLALVLGQQQEISQQVLEDYQFAGAVHILSVSGLHVGFILLFLNFFLDRLPYSRARPYIKLAVVIIGLWMFAIVAGLSPSVVRSVTMFSFVAVGMHMRRETNVFHTLLVSMLLILLIRPVFIFDVGFQLSYASLFFILWVQPILAAYYTPRNKAGKHLYDILTVSLAAQLGALPISIYYFHQFPGLFFITNLVILPFTGLIMGVSVVVMLLALAGSTPEILIGLLENMIRALNSVIHHIASADSFVIKDIPMNTAVLITAYLATVMLVLYLEKRDIRRLIGCLMAIFVLQLSVCVTLWNKGKENELIVFNKWKSSMVAERRGDEVIIMSGDSITALDRRHMISPYAVANYCNEIKYSPLQHLHYFKGKKILRIDSSSVILPCKPHVLLLTDSPRINLERTLEYYRPEVVVADASNYRTYINGWRKTCADLNIPFYATTERGYYRIR